MCNENRKDKMTEQEMKRIIETEINKLIILEKQVAEIQVQLKIFNCKFNKMYTRYPEFVSGSIL